MVYHADSMELEVIWEAFHGTVNDVVVCRDLSSVSGDCYTVLVIHDRQCRYTMLDIMQQAEQGTQDSTFFQCFTQNEALCFAFPYRAERKFTTFAAGQMLTPATGEAICVNLVMECLSTPLPWPLLYLVLRQDNIHITKDNEVYFTLHLDLEDLNLQRDESACVSYCAHVLLELLSGRPTHGRRSRKALKSFELIRKKCDKHAYSGFPELYRDIKLTSIPTQKASLKSKASGVWLRNKDRLFRILMILSVTAVVIALLLLISQLIFGDIPLLRLFRHTFDVIGTENLHQ